MIIIPIYIYIYIVCVCVCLLIVIPCGGRTARVRLCSTETLRYRKLKLANINIA